MKLCTAGTGVQLCLVPLCPEGTRSSPLITVTLE